MKRVISGILALSVAGGTVAWVGGCAGNAQPQQSPAAGVNAPLAPQANPAGPIHQPLAEQAHADERAANAPAPRYESTENGYQPVIAAEIPSDRVIARVNGQAITMADLQRPLIEGYGLRVLIFQARLSLARQKAVEQKVTYDKADVDAELERTLKGAFKDAAREDYPTLLTQLLERQGVSRAEFDMLIETNAILRRIAEPQLKDKINDQNLTEMFNAVYGETAVLKHIQAANPQEAMQARTRLAAGEKWEDVVRTMSRNARTAALDGELPPFSRQTVNWGAGWGKVPEGFKNWAFGAGVKVGDVSDPIQAEGGYHILKLERKIQPKVVKFEDVKETLRAELYQKLVDQGVSELRNQLGAMVNRAMVIDEPALRKQYEAKVSEQEKAIKDEERIREQLKSRIKAAEDVGTTTRPAASTRPAAATQPAAATRPLTPPATPPTQTTPAQTTPGTPAPAQPGPAAAPGNAPAGEQPPATKSGGGPDTTTPAK